MNIDIEDQTMVEYNYKILPLIRMNKKKNFFHLNKIDIAQQDLSVADQESNC